MRITRSQLRMLIREEVQSAVRSRSRRLREEHAPGHTAGDTAFPVADIVGRKGVPQHELDLFDALNVAGDAIGSPGNGDALIDLAYQLQNGQLSYEVAMDEASDAMEILAGMNLDGFESAAAALSFQM